MNSAVENLISLAGKGLSDFHKDLIWRMLEQDFEYGGTYEYDYDELVRCLKEEPDFAGVEEKCAHYYLTILNSGFDEDYREHHGLSDFEDEYEEGDFEESAKVRSAKRSLKEFEDDEELDWFEAIYTAFPKLTDKTKTYIAEWYMEDEFPMDVDSQDELVQFVKEDLSVTLIEIHPDETKIIEEVLERYPKIYAANILKDMLENPDDY